MKQPILDPSWHESWKYSFQYDLVEIYGSKQHLDHAYAYQNRMQHVLDMIQSIAALGAKILDVAAAQGNFSLLLAEQGYEVTWNDLREELVGYVQLKYQSGTIHFASGDVFSLNFEDHFDIVLITEIIEHVAHPDDFLRKISQLIKPGGFIVMTTPNGEYFRNNLPRFSECADPSIFESVQFKPNADGHIFLLYLDEIEKLADTANLLVSEVRFFNNPLTNGYLKLESILQKIPLNWVYRLEALTNTLPSSAKRKLHTSMAVLFSRCE